MSMLTLRRLSDPADFLSRAHAYLRAAEAENVLMLGICEARDFDDSCYLAVVEEDGAVVACGIRTPPYSALLTRAERGALEVLAADLFERYPDMETVAGPEPTAALFSELWSALAGTDASLETGMRVLQARKVVQPAPPAGRFRQATQADVPTLERWAAAFAEEVGLHPGDSAREQVDEGRVFVWEDEGLTSMAAWTGRTGRTVRVNAVFTPPALRGRGYASACVASLTQRLLDEGADSCCLYTEAANPTSNKIYEAVGYRLVCDAGEYRLRPS